MTLPPASHWRFYVESDGRTLWLRSMTVAEAIREVRRNTAHYPEQTLDIYDRDGNEVAVMVDTES